jgi:hypothetical protein
VTPPPPATATPPLDLGLLQRCTFRSSAPHVKSIEESINDRARSNEPEGIQPARNLRRLLARC